MAPTNPELMLRMITYLESSTDKEMLERRIAENNPDAQTLTQVELEEYDREVGQLR